MPRRRANVSTVTGDRGITVKVEGLTELRRDLKAAGEKNLDRRLSTRLRRAAEIVAKAAREKVPDGPERGGHIKTSIKASATTKGAFVSGGKQEFAYYGWLDFGSRTPNKGTFNGQSGSARRAQARQVSGSRVGPWAASGAGPKGGRFIYPAIEENSTALVAETRAAVDQALKEANL